jgi:hypothetical protein
MYFRLNYVSMYFESYYTGATIVLRIFLLGYGAYATKY